jgi:hypothetical protein
MRRPHAFASARELLHGDDDLSLCVPLAHVPERVGEQHFAEGPHHEVSAFELGLDLILDGLEKIRDTEANEAAGS